MSRRFDATGRSLLARHPNDWLPLFGLDRNLPVQVADSDVSAASAAADVVLLVDTGGAAPEVLHLEFQTSRDPILPERVLRYNCLLAARHERPVCSAVVLLRSSDDGPAMRGPYERTSPLGPCSVVFRFPVLRVWELPVDLLLAASGTAPLAPLARGVTEAVLPELIGRLEQVFALEPPADVPDLWAMTGILMALTYPPALIRQLMKGKPMRDNPLVQSWIEEGRQEGELATERRMLLRWATRRFGSPDAATRAKVEALADKARLEALLDRVLDAVSWDDLLADLA
jgi:hypothetical protein